MLDAAVNFLFAVYRPLPLLNRMHKEGIHKGCLRILYFFPFLLNKNHHIEGLFRKIFLLNFSVSALALSVYFWYVVNVSQQGIMLQALVIPMVVNWVVCTFYCKKLHGISQDYEANKKLSKSTPYLYHSWTSLLPYAAFLFVAAGVDNIQINHPHELVYQYIYLVFLSNYLSYLFTMEVNIGFIQSDVFNPKWVRILWVLGPVYLFFRNIF